MEAIAQTIQPVRGICLSVVLMMTIAGTVYLIVRMTGTRVIIVKQEKRLVIYRLGVFQDVAGPGVVMINPHVDTIEREINVRSEQRIHTVGSYFIYGVPFGYVLSFWRRIDLKQAAGGDRDMLAHLAQYSDDEREEQIQEKLHQAFQKCVPIIEGENQLPDNPQLGAKLLPILPCTPACDRLFALVMATLQRTLPTIGVFPDMRQPTVLAIRSINVPPEVMAGFSNDRSLTMLREQFHDLPEDMLLHALSLMRGVDPRMTRLYVEGSGASAFSTARFDEEGEFREVKVGSPAAPPQFATQPKALPAPTPLADDELTEEDWRVLKPAPRASNRG